MLEIAHTTYSPFERLWHTIIVPAAQGLEWFVWRSVTLAFLIKLMFFTPAH